MLLPTQDCLQLPWPSWCSLQQWYFFTAYPACLELRPLIFWVGIQVWAFFIIMSVVSIINRSFFEIFLALNSLCFGLVTYFIFQRHFGLLSGSLASKYIRKFFDFSDWDWDWLCNHTAKNFIVESWSFDQVSLLNYQENPDLNKIPLPAEAPTLLLWHCRVYNMSRFCFRCSWSIPLRRYWESMAQQIYYIVVQDRRNGKQQSAHAT